MDDTIVANTNNFTQATAPSFTYLSSLTLLGLQKYSRLYGNSWELPLCLWSKKGCFAAIWGHYFFAWSFTPFM